jgi:hypothetical protein
MYGATVSIVPLLSIAAALLAAGGCGGSSCPTHLHPSADSVLRAHRGLRAPAVAIRAEASVDQRGRDGRIRGTVLMFIERPESVRFDAMTQFGPAAILTSDGTGFALTDLRENRYLVGETCPRNIARLLGIPLAGSEVARLLLGDTPFIEHAEESMECNDDGSYLVRLSAPDGTRQEIELSVRTADVDAPPSEQRLRLLRSEVFAPSGGTVWRATFEDHEVIEDPLSTASPKLGVAMPMTVRFEHPGEGADTLLRFESIELNVEVPAEAFAQRPRPGITVEQVLCDE